MQYLKPLEENTTLQKAFPNEDPDVLMCKVVVYLQKGFVFIMGRGDFEHPDLPGMNLPIGQATDGEWAWPLSAAELCIARKITPSKEFIQHVLDTKTPPQKLTDEQISEAIKTATQRTH